MSTAISTRTPASAAAPQQVVVVSKQSHMEGLLETVLDAGQYDVVFVESTEHAYSHIKRLGPDLIIVCLDVDDLDGFQVLSMLKLDTQTKVIPIVTCTATGDGDEAQDDPLDLQDTVFCESPTMCMN
jgi:DNA-binding response OmpR family regulator